MQKDVSVLEVQIALGNTGVVPERLISPAPSLSGQNTQMCGPEAKSAISASTADSQICFYEKGCQVMSEH